MRIIENQTIFGLGKAMNMTKKTAKAEATKKDIISAALELFFEKGYESTSIRMITAKAGIEVGSFYYHFASKDKVMEAAVDLFFASYEEQMRLIVNSAGESPDGLLTRYIEYINEATQSFRAQYLKTLHWSILGAIREHTMLIMKRYIREILELYVEKGVMANPGTDMKIAVNLLAFGVGGSILYQSADEYERQQPDMKRRVIQMLELTGEL